MLAVLSVLLWWQFFCDLQRRSQISFIRAIVRFYHGEARAFKGKVGKKASIVLAYHPAMPCE